VLLLKRLFGHSDAGGVVVGATVGVGVGATVLVGVGATVGVDVGATVVVGVGVAVGVGVGAMVVVGVAVAEIDAEAVDVVATGVAPLPGLLEQLASSSASVPATATTTTAAARILAGPRTPNFMALLPMVASASTQL
jgi:hypothetical protein